MKYIVIYLYMQLYYFILLYITTKIFVARYQSLLHVLKTLEHLEHLEKGLKIGSAFDDKVHIISILFPS